MRKRSIWGTSIALVIVALVARGYASGSPPSGGAVQGIRIAEAEGTTTLTIAANRRPTFTTWKLEQPPRVVVDISGARTADLDVPFDAGTYAVGAVSATVTTEDGAPHTRVVVTLRQPGDYQVSAEGTNILVRIVPFVRPTVLSVKEATKEPVKGPARDPAREAAQAAALMEAQERVAQEAARAKHDAEEIKRAAEQARLAVASETRRLVVERASVEESRLRADSARTAMEERARQLKADEARTETARKAAEAALRTAEARAEKVRADQARSDSSRQQVEAARRDVEAKATQLHDEQLAAAAARKKVDQARAEATATSDRLKAEEARVESSRHAAELALKAALQQAGALKVQEGRAEEARHRAELAQRDLEQQGRKISEERLQVAQARHQAEAAAAQADAKTQELRNEQNRAELVRRQAEAARLEAVAESARLRAERAAAEKAKAEALVAQEGARQGARQGVQLALIDRKERERQEAHAQEIWAGQRQAALQAKEAADRARLEAERARAQAEAAQLAARTEREQAEASGARMKGALLIQKSEAERLRAEVEKARADQRQAEARAKEALATQRAEQAQAEAQARATLARERAEVERARAEADQAQKASRAERERADQALKLALAAQARLEVRAKGASDAEGSKLHAQVEDARRESERARTAAQQAAAVTERLAAEKVALDTLRKDLEGRAQALAKAEAEVRRAQNESTELRDRARQTEKQAELARLREEQRGNAVKDAAAEVEARRRALEAKLEAQELQRRKLLEAERLVTERELAVKASADELVRREQTLKAASAHKLALENAGAAEQARLAAGRAAALADKRRTESLAAAASSRQALAEAIAARETEEGRRKQVERERLDEERRYRQASALRTAEDERRLAAEQARRKEETRLVEVQANKSRLETERTKLEAEREGLTAEIKRLRVEQAQILAVRKTATPPAKMESLAKVPAGAAAVAAGPRLATWRTPDSAPVEGVRPRSITITVPSHVQRIDFVDEPSRSSIIIDLDEPSLYVVESVGSKRVSLRLLHADLPRGLERSLDATEYLGPVRVISSYRDPGDRGAVRVDVELAEEVPSRVRQDGSRLYWDFQKGIAGAALATPPVGAHCVAHSLVARYGVTRVSQVAGMHSGALLALPLGQTLGGPPMPRPPATPRRRYAGRRIDLDFKGADIHNILRLLADVGGVNVITSDDVKAEVTIKMKDVPWDQALDMILRQKNLGQVREGNLIRVAPLQVLEKELEQEIARQKQITDVLPTETRLIGVSYAEAKLLQEKAKDLLSARGKISTDERTNTLIVSDVSKNLGLVEELVRNLDTQTSMVVIEARIVEARSNFVRQIGIQWGGSAFADAAHGNPTGLAFPYNIGVGGGATDATAATAGLVPGPASGTGTASPNFAVNLPAAVGTGSGGALGLTFGSVSGAFNINLRISALENTGQVRILSSPRVATMDNMEASIEQGVAIPIQIVSAMGTQTTFVDAKLNLTVKPHVTNDGTVMMQMHVTRNEPDFVNTGARGDPTILKKEARNTMLVKDGDTAVIGGIYQRNSGLSYAKVPFLADIPVVGVLFRARKENDDRTEFLVFITPRIANRSRVLGN